MSTTLTIPSEAEQLVRCLNETDEWQALNKFERECADRPQLPCPLRHTFTPVPGYPELHLYAREIVMPKGGLFTSRIHLYKHPFVISSGVLSIWSADHGWQLFRAPYSGVTLPGARRALFIHETTTFTTFHVTKLTDPEKIVEEVTFDPMELNHLAGLDPAKLAEISANMKGLPK